MEYQKITNLIDDASNQQTILIAKSNLKLQC